MKQPLFPFLPPPLVSTGKENTLTLSPGHISFIRLYLYEHNNINLHNTQVDSDCCIVGLILGSFPPNLQSVQRPTPPVCTVSV